jgi:hypothetical protein
VLGASLDIDGAFYRTSFAVITETAIWHEVESTMINQDG